MKIEPIRESTWAGPQVERLSGLDFFPTTKAGMKELRLALEQCANEATARAIVDEWLARNTAAPKPAQIRELVYQANEQHRRALARLPNCQACAGSGGETRWYLVTYYRNDFGIKRVERLQLGWEDLRDLQATVNPYPPPNSTFDAQDILSAALKCVACNGSGKQRAAA